MRTLLADVALGACEGQGVVVDDARISWIGPMSQAPGVERRIDLDGCLLLPAFVDSHVHATAAGLSLTGLDLHGTASLPAALARIAAHADAHPGQLIFGTGWDETTWPERRAPNLGELNVATRGAPAYLSRVDVHSAVVSTTLLERCPKALGCKGFDPSGHLRLEAHHVLRRAAQQAITSEQRLLAQRATLARAGELGVAAIHEMAGPDISGRADLESLLQLARAEAGPSVCGYWAELGQTDIVAELDLAGAAGDLFCDGAFGSHTAALHEPYRDDPDNRGSLYFSDEQVTDHLRQATSAGIQAGFHCIGDASIDQVARAFEAVAVEYGDAAVRACHHRLEHLEMPSSSALHTFARLDAVASVQPGFDAAWGGRGRMYETRLGAARAAGLNPFASFAAAGMTLALGSDAPVTPIDPWGAMAAAVGHRRVQSRLTVDQAMAASTVGGWTAAGDRRPGIGTIAVGAPAHLAAWSIGQLPGDPLGAALAGVIEGGPAPRCELTLVEGGIIHPMAQL
ncbi:amidohydrolase [soil metagenome]